MNAAERRAMQVTVSQWRANRGPRGRRLGWGDAEAASIAGIPTRTLIHYRTTGLAWATVLIPERGVDKPIWCAGDVLCARVVWDLSEQGTPMSVIAEAADWLHRWRTDGDTDAIDIRKIAKKNLELIIPTEPELREAAPPEAEEDGYLWFTEDDLSAFDEWIVRHPLSERARELLVRIEVWWSRVDSRPERQPEWL